MKRPRILVVEDDESMLELYRVFFEILHPREFSWSAAQSGGRVSSALRAGDRPSVVILDWELPDMSGLEVLERLRRDPSFSELPVIVVTAKDELQDRVSALEAGADDYFVKPVIVEELLARLRGILSRRRPTPAEERKLVVHDLELDLATTKLKVRGRPVHLFAKELGLLVTFLRRPNMIHSSAYLWDTVWGYENPNAENIVEVAISNLRRKLGPVWARRLETHRRKGYLLSTEGR
jgi:DNA-binding response OmpR family regulator